MKSISFQILASILITVVIFSGGWGYFEIQNRKDAEIRFLNESKTRTANRLSLNLSYPIWNLNFSEVKKFIEIEAHDKEEILCIQIFDENDSLYTGIYRDPITGKLHYLNHDYLIENRNTLEQNNDFVARPIMMDGRNIGAVIVYPNQKPLNHLIDILSIELIAKMLSLSLILAGILFLVMRKVVIKPLIHLRNWSSGVTPGKSIPKIRAFKSSEMESLHQSYSEMANRLMSSLEEISEKNRLLELSESQIKSISNNFEFGMIYQLISRIDGYREFTYISDSVQKLYGITPEEAMADASLIYGKIHPEDVEFLNNAEIEAIKEMKAFKTEARMMRTSGSYRWSSFVSTPILREDGSIRWDGIEFDITELKETEEELRISQQKLAVAFNSSPDAILITEQETGTIIEANDALMNIFKYNREEAIGRTTLELGLFKNPEDRQKIHLIIQENGSIHNLEIAGKDKFGTELTLLLSAEKTIINQTPSFILNLHDITERKKIEEELRVSQEKFAIAFNSSPDAIVISEMETGIIIESNDAIKNIFGYSREEVIGKSGMELNMYKDPSDRLHDFEVFNKYGYIRNLEITRRHRSGSDVIILLSLELSNINGKQCFIATLHDITENKRAEEKLRESEERFKSIVAVSNTGAWEYHADTEFLWCSPEYFSMLGRHITDYDISGKANLTETWIELIHPEDREQAASHFAEYLNNKSVGIYESYFRMKHIEGHWIWIWSRGQTLRDANGNPTSITLGTHIDITLQKKNELDLENLNRDKDRFMSILGHDLRNPFNAIVGILDLLSVDFSNMSQAETEEMLQMAQRSAHNASELLDDVLLWATAQSGKMPFTPQLIDCKENCLHILEIFHSIADAKSIKLTLDISEGLKVNADKNMLNTILRNLVSNALKFTPNGGEIIISAKNLDEETTISIADNGVGILPEDLDKIFSKSQLFTSVGTANEKGTGLGLKICQDFVERHNGRIWVESEPGNGTTFYFSLPEKSSI